MSESMSKRKRALLTVISGAALIAWLWVIWHFSAQNGDMSQDLSDGFSAGLFWVLERLGLAEKERILDWIVAMAYPVRKCAHFAEYFILGLLATAHFHVGWPLMERKFLKAWIFVFLAASADEIHQLFVPGRSGMARDVLLDSAAGAVSILVVYFIRFMYTERRKKDVKERSLK